MMDVGAKQTHSENGWTVTYRKIGANRVYFQAAKTVNFLGAGANQLEMASFPIKVSFTQYLTLILNVAGQPVGYGDMRVVAGASTSAIYRDNTEYSANVSMLVFGELTVDP